MSNVETVGEPSEGTLLERISPHSSWIFVEECVIDKESSEQNKYYLNCSGEPVAELTEKCLNLEPFVTEHQNDSDSISVISDSDDQKEPFIDDEPLIVTNHSSTNKGDGGTIYKTLLIYLFIFVLFASISIQFLMNHKIGNTVEISLKDDHNLVDLEKYMDSENYHDVTYDDREEADLTEAFNYEESKDIYAPIFFDLKDMLEEDAVVPFLDKSSETEIIAEGIDIWPQNVVPSQENIKSFWDSEKCKKTKKFNKNRHEEFKDFHLCKDYENEIERKEFKGKQGEYKQRNVDKAKKYKLKENNGNRHEDKQKKGEKLDFNPIIKHPKKNKYRKTKGEIPKKYKGKDGEKFERERKDSDFKLDTISKYDNSQDSYSIEMSKLKNIVENQDRQLRKLTKILSEKEKQLKFMKLRIFYEMYKLKTMQYEKERYIRYRTISGEWYNNYFDERDKLRKRNQEARRRRENWYTNWMFHREGERSKQSL